MIRAKVLGRKYSTYNLDLGSLRHLFLPIVSAHCYCASKSTPHVHCLPQRPRSFWSAPRIATLGADQRERGIWKRECENIGPPFDLYMLRVQRHVSILFCFCSFELSKQPITLVNQTYCSQACVVRKEDSPHHVFQARAPSRNSTKYRADLCVNLVCEYFCWKLRRWPPLFFRQITSFSDSFRHTKKQKNLYVESFNYFSLYYWHKVEFVHGYRCAWLRSRIFKG